MSPVRSILASALFALLFASSASAQTLADRLAPDGLVLLEVRAPDDVRLPVRLTYAPSQQRSAEVRVDVWATADRAAALRRADAVAGTAASGLDAVAGIGNRAYGDRGMVVFARGRWVTDVRVLGGRHDALAIARVIDGALASATPGANAPRMRFDNGAVRFDGDVIASWVTASGSAYARRTPTGWIVVRTGDGPFEVRAVAVTPDLAAWQLGDGD